VNTMNQTESNMNKNGKFLGEKTSNFLKGLGAYSAVVLTNISWIIVIAFLIGGHSFIIDRLLLYIYISVLFLVCYSLVTTKTTLAPITYKLMQIIKRFFDVVFAASIIFFLMPLFLLLALAIKLESSGPVLFRSKRVGQFGVPFDIYRFRTMNIKAGDKQITRVGNFLRRTSLYTLPMYINVLNGELSLIGPWARSPESIAKFIDADKKILTVKPGLSGLWQISNAPEQLIPLDLKYVETWSLWLDFKILVKTPYVVLFNNKKSA
jgi:lipopolysaccharide/colanic/teichoic acid biosynthesis glycosyltransferase